MFARCLSLALAHALLLAASATGSEDVEIPWTDDEELLSDLDATQQIQEPGSGVDIPWSDEEELLTDLDSKMTGTDAAVEEAFAGGEAAVLDIVRRRQEAQAEALPSWEETLGDSLHSCNQVVLRALVLAGVALGLTLSAKEAFFGAADTDQTGKKAPRAAASALHFLLPLGVVAVDCFLAADSETPAEWLPSY
eukprot:TRINITY_DN9172_c0_g1_i2.p1 TRINITY_DN9172_c0_g1~~TRINITY_DN9172_c0_g1_i2.p1  ORF type:complete len:194 (-),score=56.38 TRINITY_DN9172_c0_g1_i2:87-668(-)